MAAISRNGTSWTPWSTYNNGAYTRYLAAANVAVVAVYGGGLTVPASTRTFDPVGFCVQRIKDGRNPFEATLDTIDRIRAYIESKVA